MPQTASFQKNLLVGLLFLLISSQVGPVLAEGLAWTGNGPEGGHVRTLVIDPITPTTLYAGTSSGGLLKSTNSGGSWSRSSTGLPNTSFNCLVISPATPTTLYVGTFDGGVFRSMNGGESWSALNTNLPTTTRI